MCVFTYLGAHIGNDAGCGAMVCSISPTSMLAPFSVFPLYAHTRLVKGHFLTLRRQSGTLSLTKSGHPTPSHPPNHHLKLIFSAVLLMVCVGGARREGERWGQREGGGERGGREREN